MGTVCRVPEATWSFPGSSFGLMAVSKMRFGVSCASFEPSASEQGPFSMLFRIFSRVHRLHWHEGYIFPEGLLGGSGKPFGNHLRGLGVSSGVPGSILVLSWRLLGVSQGSLGRVRGASWLCLPCVFLYLVANAGIFVRISLRTLAKSCFLIIFVRDWCFCSVQKKLRFPFHALTGLPRGPFLLLFAVLSRGQLKIRVHLSGRLSWGVLGAFWEAFGWLLGRLGVALRVSWQSIGVSWESLGVLLGGLFVSWRVFWRF